MNQFDDNQISANLLCLIAGASTEINRGETADEGVAVLEYLGLREEQVPKVHEHLLSALMHLSEIDSLMRS